MGYRWDDESTWGPEPEPRWFHHYLYLLVTTCVISAFAWFATDRTNTPIVMTFGLMGFLCFPFALAEMSVMGFTAKFGGFVAMLVTCYFVCSWLPLQ